MIYRLFTGEAFLRRLAGVMLAAAGLIWAPAAFAKVTCTSVPAAIGNAYKDYSLPYSANVPVNAAVGDPFGPTVHIEVSISCKGTSDVDGTEVKLMLQPGGLSGAAGFANGTVAYPTVLLGGTPNVGIRLMSTTNQQLDFRDVGLLGPAMLLASKIFNKTVPSTLDATLAFDAVLVKTSDPAVDYNAYRNFGRALMQIASSVPGSVSVGSTGEDIFMVLRLNGSGALTTAACTVDSESATKTVTLPPVTAMELSGSLTATAKKTPFEITLTCPTANKGVSISLSSANMKNTSSGIILPTTSSTPGEYAANVGVRLLGGTARGTPVKFDSFTSVADTAGKTKTAGGNQKFAIPFAAEYIRTSATTADAVGAGAVLATATFNITYQ